MDVTNSDLFSNTVGSGDAGTITLTGEHLTLTNSRISSAAVFDSSGNAGTITLTGEHLTLTNSDLDSNAMGSGDAGNINLQGQTVLIHQDTAVTSSSVREATGAAGTVTVQGLRGAGTPARTVLVSHSTISTTAERKGLGGAISVAASEVVQLARISQGTHGATLP
jgi:hypothetical protein